MLFQYPKRNCVCFHCFKHETLRHLITILDNQNQTKGICSALHHFLGEGQFYTKLCEFKSLQMYNVENVKGLTSSVSISKILYFI